MILDRRLNGRPNWKSRHERFWKRNQLRPRSRQISAQIFLLAAWESRKIGATWAAQTFAFGYSVILDTRVAGSGAPMARRCHAIRLAWSID